MFINSLSCCRVSTRANGKAPAEDGGEGDSDVGVLTSLVFFLLQAACSALGRAQLLSGGFLPLQFLQVLVATTCLFFSFFVFLGLHLPHMEDPRLGVESEL